MTPLTATLIATIGVSLLSLSGLLLTSMRAWTETLELRLLSFAAGVLIATALISLLPEAIEIAGAETALQACLAALVGFYVLDRWLERGRAAGHDNHVRAGHASSARSLILIGDALHNFVDGVVIAVAFMIEPAVGWMTALSVAAHELPHEIGDYAILVRGGFSPARAVAFNLLSALTAVLGGLVAFARRPMVETEFGARPLVEANLGLFVGVAAGMFLYIAMVNLIPEVQHAGRGRHDVQTGPFLAGIALILVLGWLLPHEGRGHVTAPGDFWSRADEGALHFEMGLAHHEPFVRRQSRKALVERANGLRAIGYRGASVPLPDLVDHPAVSPVASRPKLPGRSGSSTTRTTGSPAS